MQVGGRGLRCVGGCKPGEGGREGHGGHEGFGGYDGLGWMA